MIHSLQMAPLVLVGIHGAHRPGRGRRPHGACNGWWRDCFRLLLRRSWKRNDLVTMITPLSACLMGLAVRALIPAVGGFRSVAMPLAFPTWAQFGLNVQLLVQSMMTLFGANLFAHAYTPSIVLPLIRLLAMAMVLHTFWHWIRRASADRRSNRGSSGGRVRRAHSACALHVGSVIRMVSISATRTGLSDCPERTVARRHGRSRNRGCTSPGGSPTPGFGSGWPRSW